MNDLIITPSGLKTESHAYLTSLVIKCILFLSIGQSLACFPGYAKFIAVGIGNLTIQNLETSEIRTF